MGLHGPQEVLRDVSWDLQPVVVEINDKGHLGNLGFNCFQFSMMHPEMQEGPIGALLRSMANAEPKPLPWSASAVQRCR
jgi:hypothetical protein